MFSFGINSFTLCKSSSFVFRHESSSWCSNVFIMIKQCWNYRNYKLAQLRVTSLFLKPKIRVLNMIKVTTQETIATARAHAQLNSRQCNRARFSRINSLTFLSNIMLDKPAKRWNIVLHAKFWMKIFERGATKRSDMFIQHNRRLLIDEMFKKIIV